jgi:hypothetical protein
MAMTIRASSMGTSIVLPRTLRAEVKELSDRTGQSFGAIVRQALAARVAEHKEKPLESDVELQDQ